MDMTDWATYVARTAGRGERQVDIARRTTIDQTTVSRWVRAEPHAPVSPVNVTRFARAYGRPVLEAFVHAGLIDAADAKVKVIRTTSLAHFTIAELLAELAQRAAGEREDDVS